MGKKTQKQREDAFLRLLSNFTVEQQQNLPERVDLIAFFDLLDEHNVQVRVRAKGKMFFLYLGRKSRIPLLRKRGRGSPTRKFSQFI